MSDIIIEKIQSVILELDDRSKYYRKVHQESVDIEDLEEALSIQNEAFEKIQKLKGYKSVLSNLMEDISNSAISQKTTEDELPLGEAVQDLIPINLMKRSDSYNEQAETEVQKSENKNVPITILEPVDIVDENMNIILRVFGKEYMVNSYGDALFQVCQILVYKKPYVIAMLQYKNEFAKYFSSKEIRINSPKKLTNGIYMETQVDRETTMNLIQQIFSMCKYKSEAINFNIIG